jgi:hypothetical protein
MAKKRKKPRKEKIVLEWMRAKKDQTDCAHRTIWESRCRRYKVVESVSKLAELGTTYYAIRRQPHEFIISKHRKGGPAKSACVKDVNK